MIRHAPICFEFLKSFSGLQWFLPDVIVCSILAWCLQTRFHRGPRQFWYQYVRNSIQGKWKFWWILLPKSFWLVIFSHFSYMILLLSYTQFDQSWYFMLWSIVDNNLVSIDFNLTLQDGWWRLSLKDFGTCWLLSVLLTLFGSRKFLY